MYEQCTGLHLYAKKALSGLKCKFNIIHSHQKHALAGGLAVEQAVGGVGLVEAPAVGEQRVHVDPAVGDEAGAVGLADGREGP